MHFDPPSLVRINAPLVPSSEIHIIQVEFCGTDGTGSVPSLYPEREIQGDDPVVPAVL